jgi:hypothetical protein
MGVSIPSLSMTKVDDKKNEETKAGHRRVDSNSSRGSIGRKERLRNALTGRSDMSDGGAD